MPPDETRGRMAPTTPTRGEPSGRAATHTLAFRRSRGEALLTLVQAAFVWLLFRDDLDERWVRVGLTWFIVLACWSAATVLRRRVTLAPDGVSVRRVSTRHWAWSEVLDVTGGGVYRDDLRMRVRDRRRPLVLDRGWVTSLDGVRRPRGEVSGHALALWRSGSGVRV